MLKGATTLGAITLAGCSGNGDGGDGDDGGDGGDGDDGGSQTYDLNIAATGSGSSTQQAAQALARAASQHSDKVSISVQNTDGWTANLYEYDAGNFQFLGVDNNSLAKAMAERPPFDEEPFDKLPMQGFIFTSLEIHMVALEGSGLESSDDLLDGGYTIYPIQPGYGTRLLTEEVLKEAGYWEPNDILNVDTGDISGAVAEGRADALCVYGANGVNLSGWVQEVDVRSDGGLYLLEPGENLTSAIDNVAGATRKDYDEYPYEWEQDVTKVTNTTTAWVLAGQWVFGPDIPAEATREVARIASEHHEALREADPTALDHSGVESMTQAVIPDLEIHPGIANYWKDNDAWNDEWMVGETN